MLREGEVRNTGGTLPTKYSYTNSWQPQAEMTYDGLGNRLAMTGYADDQSVSTQYVLDQGKVLLATANSQTTAYLYGLGVIGSQTDAWSYLLPDGLNSSRQLADASGQITQAASYTPWGDTWAVNGASLAYGYLGGMMDTATGLIYVGNGQYYDPSTGRFLTRDANPNQTNPYVPWKSDPTSLLISPLALLALVYTGKRKRSKLDIVVVLMVVCGVVGLGLAGCGPTTPGGGTPGIVTPPPAEQPGQSGTEYPSTPTPGGTPIETPTYTCTPSLLPTLIAGGSYNPLLAIDFAKRFMTPEKMKNAGFEIWDETKCEDCTNCTNFVSYALKEGGLLPDEIWDVDKNAWYRTDDLYHYLKDTVGFHPTTEFENSGNYIYTSHPYTKESLDEEKDLFLRLRENHQSFESKQLITQRWGDYLESIINVQPGDLVFYENWKKEGWSHVGIITEGWQPPTHDFFNESMNPDFSEPRMIDHDGIGNLTQPRSIGDTWSMQIYKVIILRAP